MDFLNLAHTFLATLDAQGERPAVIEPNGASLTYAELASQIRAFMAHLRAEGFEAGDSAVVQVPNGITFTVVTVSVLALGGVAVLCEPGLGDEVYFSRLRVARPRWVFVHPIIVWANRIPGARAFLKRRELLVPPLLRADVAERSVVVSNKSLRSFATRAASVTTTIADRDSRDDAVVIFTGGTTSMPKGVRLSHGALQHYLGNIAGLAQRLPISKFLADTPQQVLYALNLGKSVLVTKGRTQKRAAFVLRAIREGKIDAYFGSPFLWVEMMAQTGDTRTQLPGTLKAVLLGGAPVTPEFLRRLRDWLHPDTEVIAIYGLTESGPVCTVSDREKIAWSEPGDFVGAPLEGVRLGLDQTKGLGDIGEVIVHSDSLYSGYIGEAARANADGLRTGDLGRLVDRDGKTALVLLGREKDMIIRAGVNVYPATLEPAIRDLRDAAGAAPLRECALIGLWNADRQDEEIVLCYELAHGGSIDERTIRSAVEKITGPDAAPDHYLLVDAIPVTGRQNKIDKAALRALAAKTFHCEARPPHEARA